MFFDTIEQKHPIQTKACGVLFLDWDGTIVTKFSPYTLLDKEKISRVLLDALENDIDIHIITARVNDELNYKFILSVLRELGIFNNKFDEVFWRKRLHCIIQDQAEMNVFKKDLQLSNKQTSIRKAELIRKLCKEHYKHLNINEKYFYDDNHANYEKVKEYKDATATFAQQANPQRHLDHMENAVKNMSVSGYLKKTQLERAHLLNNIKKCLQALYPNKTVRKKAETAFYEIHELIKGPELCPIAIIKLHAIAKKQLNTFAALLPTLLGGRDPMLQQFYSILEKLRAPAETTLPSLKQIMRVNYQLQGLLVAIQLKQNPTPSPPNAAPMALD